MITGFPFPVFGLLFSILFVVALNCDKVNAYGGVTTLSAILKGAPWIISHVAVAVAVAQRWRRLPEGIDGDGPQCTAVQRLLGGEVLKRSGADKLPGFDEVLPAAISTTCLVPASVPSPQLSLLRPAVVPGG